MNGERASQPGQPGLFPAPAGERHPARRTTARAAVIAAAAAVLLFVSQPLPYLAYRLARSLARSRPFQPDPDGAIAQLDLFGSWPWIAGVIAFALVIFFAARPARRISAWMDVLLGLAAVIVYMAPFTVAVMTDGSVLTAGLSGALLTVALCFTYWLNGWAAAGVAAIALWAARHGKAARERALR